MVNLYTQNWKLENISCVLFDKDGTILDSHIYWGRIIERRSLALISAYELSFDRHDELCKVMGLDLKSGKLLEKGPIALVSRNDVIKIMVDYFKKHNLKISDESISDIFDKEHKLFNKELTSYINPLPGALDLIRRLKRKNIKIAIVTSDTVDNTISILNHWKVTGFFDFIVGKETLSESKETGIPALHALKHFNMNPEFAITIGDAPIDILMANNAKMKAGIGVTTGQVPAYTLSTYTNYVCDTLLDVHIEV